MIPTPPIVLHLARPDYVGVRCGCGEMVTAFWSLKAAEGAIRSNPDRYTMCEACRRQSAQEEETNETE